MKGDDQDIVAHGARMVSPPRTAQQDATLRDLFAIAALAGQNLSGIGWKHKAEQAYAAADAMLSERGKGND